MISTSRLVLCCLGITNHGKGGERFPVAPACWLGALFGVFCLVKGDFIALMGEGDFLISSLLHVAL